VIFSSSENTLHCISPFVPQANERVISFQGEPLRQVAGWVHEYERFWNTHLDQFERYFTKKKEKKQQEKKR
jgi:hypothetical protein